MNSNLEDMVEYLAGRDGEAAERVRAGLTDPDSTACQFLTATRTLSRHMLGKHVVKWLGVLPHSERAIEASTPPQAPPTALRTVARVGPWLLAVGACILAGLVWQDCRMHRLEPEQHQVAALDKVKEPTTPDKAKPSTPPAPQETENQPANPDEPPATGKPSVVVIPETGKGPPQVVFVPGTAKEPPSVLVIPGTPKSPPVVFIPGIAKKPQPVVEPIGTKERQLEVDLREAKSRIALLETALAKANEVKKELVALQAQNAQLKSDLKAANAQAAQLKIEKDRSKALDNSVKTANAKIVGMTKDLQNANNQIKILTTELKKLKR